MMMLSYELFKVARSNRKIFFSQMCYSQTRFFIFSRIAFFLLLEAVTYYVCTLPRCADTNQCPAYILSCRAYTCFYPPEFAIRYVSEHIETLKRTANVRTMMTKRDHNDDFFVNCSYRDHEKKVKIALKWDEQRHFFFLDCICFGFNVPGCKVLLQSWRKKETRWLCRFVTRVVATELVSF